MYDIVRFSEVFIVLLSYMGVKWNPPLTHPLTKMCNGKLPGPCHVRQSGKLCHARFHIKVYDEESSRISFMSCLLLFLAHYTEMERGYIQ